MIRNMKYTIEFKNLPFKAIEKQVIFVENGYDEKINLFIMKYHDIICQFFQNRGYEFCYLPKLTERLTRDEESMRYYAPYKKGGAYGGIDIDSSFMLNYMVRPENRCKIKPSLVFYKEDDGLFHGITLEESHLRHINLTDAYDEIYNEYKIKSKKVYSVDDSIRFSVEEPEEEIRFRTVSVPEDVLDKETEDLLEALAETAEKLRKKGISEYILQQTVCKEVKLSRLHITKDYRIILPDFDNMEIEMTPLEKAVYFLFLRHGEGITFKRLPEYYDELLGLYKALKKRDVMTTKMEASVRALTNQEGNGINVCCSRILRFFKHKMEARLAEHYIISGERGMTKCVNLPPEMIVWE